MSFYKVINSDKNIEYFSQNRPCSFSLYLKKLFQFKEDWSVALAEIATIYSINNFTQFYVPSNICQGSYIDSELVHLLPFVNFNKDDNVQTFLRPYYLHINRESFTTMSFNINNSNQELTSVLRKPVTVKLYFKQSK